MARWKRNEGEFFRENETMNKCSKVTNVPRRCGERMTDTTVNCVNGNVEANKTPHSFQRLMINFISQIGEKNGMKGEGLKSIVVVCFELLLLFSRALHHSDP